MTRLCSYLQVLQPAIELAEQGFPVSPITAYHWAAGLGQLFYAGGESIKALLTADGKAPVAGQIQKNPDLAATFRRLSSEGAAKGELKTKYLSSDDGLRHFGREVFKGAEKW